MERVRNVMSRNIQSGRGELRLDLIHPITGKPGVKTTFFHKISNYIMLLRRNFCKKGFCVGIRFRCEIGVLKRVVQSRGRQSHKGGKIIIEPYLPFSENF